MNIIKQKFRISADIAEYIKMADLPTKAAKLLFSLIYHQDKTDESWPTGCIDRTAPEDHFVFVAQLRELGFPTRTNCSRFLREPVAELVAVSWIFDHLSISRNGRYLTWRFANDFFDAMADMEFYALVEVEEIALCRRRIDSALLAQIPLHRRKRIPEFRLFGPNKDYCAPRGYTPPKLTPHQVERQLRPSLQTWADETGMSFAVLLVQEGSHPGYTDAVIRIKHGDTKWPDGRFTKRPPNAVIWTVDP